jgi:uncharacterized RDD family membrane protein YckC
MKSNYVPVPNTVPGFVVERDIFGQIRPKRIRFLKRAKHKLINAPNLKVVYARLGARTIATLIDLTIVFGLLFILEKFFFSSTYTTIDFNIYWFLAGSFAWILYNGFFESSGYQATIGKMVLKLKVIDLYGKKLSVLRASFRCISTIISILPIGLGIWYITTDPRKQGWHDLISGSYVIKS